MVAHPRPEQAAEPAPTGHAEPVAVITIDAAGLVQHLNPHAEALTGYSRGEAVGASLEALFVPARLSGAYAAGLRRYREHGEAPLVDHCVEVPLRRRDGSEISVEVTLARVGADTFAGVLRPVAAPDTARARAAEQQARVEAARMNVLIESLGVGVLLQDQQGRVVLSNSAFVEMFAIGLGPDRLRGTPVRADSGRYADREAAARRTDETVRRGRPAIGEEFSLTDGRVVERDYMPITLDGTALGHLWVFRDVTAQAETRRGLEEHNRVLTELSALKTEFVAVVSHELRTPLTSIATFASLVDDGALGGDDRRHAVAVIRRNADRMLALVADLVLLARLGAGDTPLGAHRVDFADLVRRAGEEFGPDHLTVSVSEGPAVRGDTDLLRQAVGTVVGVVVSASDAGGRVTVDATFRAGGRPGWTLLARTPTALPASPERLLSTRLPHPDAPGECRTGAFALLLAREIAARHGGALRTSVDGCAVAVTLHLRPHA
ncbi:MAG TPA: PAS domain S-box protein [Micromonosporaceae bacterium]|nr:PAS domain S-box protein [Micromonosporaceae bacterium]